MQKRPSETKRPAWGAARIAVISLRDEITRDLLAGIPVAEIFRRHQGKLGSLTVGAFQRQVRQIVKTPAKGIAPREQNPLPSSTPIGFNDGHKSATGTFIHDPQVRQDDRQQLLGVAIPRRK